MNQLLNTMVIALAALLMSAGLQAQTVTEPPKDSVLFTDHFDGKTPPDLSAKPWRVIAVDDTQVQCITTEMADTQPHCLELSDDSPKGRPDLHGFFSRITQSGQCTARMRVDSTKQAPLSLQLRNSKGQLLISVMFQPTGKIGYNVGSNDILSDTPWTPGKWQALQLNWDAHRKVQIKLDDKVVAENLLMSEQDFPQRLVLSAGYSSGVGRKGYVDSIDVIDTTGLARTSEIKSTNNGVWIAHGFIKHQPYLNHLPTFLAQAHHQYHINQIYVNIGRVDERGILPQNTGDRAKLGEFLQIVHDYEMQNKMRFHIEAWLNGDTKNTDMAQRDVRQQIVNECARLLNPATSDSYVTSTSRRFDGVQIDLEPSGHDVERFENLMILMQDIRQSIDSSPYPGQTLSIAAHKYGDQNFYQWPLSFFYRMSQVADTICVMTYNSGLQSGPEYQQWMTHQVNSVLAAVTGSHWNFDAEHPRTARKTQVYFGMPAYPRSTYHLPEVENVRYAAMGIRGALSQLVDHPDELAHFSGASLYLHTLGDGTGGYANSTDWFDFARFWLGTR